MRMWDAGCQDFPLCIYFLNNSVQELLPFEDKDIIFFLKGNIVLYSVTGTVFCAIINTFPV